MVNQFLFGIIREQMQKKESFMKIRSMSAMKWPMSNEDLQFSLKNLGHYNTETNASV